MAYAALKAPLLHGITTCGDSSAKFPAHLHPVNAAKAAMEVLVRYFAVALAGRGITVNTISPGWIEDSVLNSLPEVFQNGLREWQERGWTPMGRLGTPADIGNAVALICSPEANWITGQLIEVDGGASLMDAHLPLEFQGVGKPRKAEAA
jgi:NAD(P)-dependent dehydrogenase (short-subunit alcohol dehydrogenase family)